MKKTLTLLALSLSIASSLTHAQSQHVIKALDPSIAINTPGYVSHDVLSGGQYLRVRIAEGAEANAQSYWLNNNVTHYKDEVLTRPKLTLQSGISALSATALATPPLFNDPLYPDQTSLQNASTQYAVGITSFREMKRKPRIAILDTGAAAHEDYTVFAGYSFTTLFDQSESDDYRPLNQNNGIRCQSNHGNAMTGIAGAKQNNNRGIAGVANAELYVGRVMSTNCATEEDEGLISDLYNGINWAAGDFGDYQLENPVDVINISLAADLPCPILIQEAIDNANSKGITVVVSAGNNGTTTNRYTPANCRGVVVVGAHGDSLNPSAYSNRGDNVSFLMHGSYMTTSTSLDGVPFYDFTIGTSGAAAAGSGFAGLIKANFPHATPEQIKKIMVDAASCSTGDNNCLSPLDATELVRTAEHVLDPKISFSHAFKGSTCQIEKQKNALSSAIGTCGAYVANVKSEYAALGNTYMVKVLRKSKSHDYVQWDDRTGKVEIVSENSITENEASIGLRGVNTQEYDYAAVACDGDFCPTPVVLSPEESGTPAECL